MVINQGLAQFDQSDQDEEVKLCWLSLKIIDDNIDLWQK